MSANMQTTHMTNKRVPEPGIPADEAIVIENFTKSYGSNRVVDELQFTVQRGEIFALLGPNGAGKTTTIETLEGYRAPDQGRVRVLGLDPIRESPAQVSFAGCVLPSGPSPCTWLSHAQSTMPDKTPHAHPAGFPFRSHPPPA